MSQLVSTSIPSQALPHIQDRLVSLIHWSQLDPGLDLLSCCQLKHLADLFGTSNVGSSQVDTASD